jgi:hypothetical protein
MQEHALHKESVTPRPNRDNALAASLPQMPRS